MHVGIIESKSSNVCSPCYGRVPHDLVMNALSISRMNKITSRVSFAQCIIRRLLMLFCGGCKNWASFLPDVWIVYILDGIVSSRDVNDGADLLDKNLCRFSNDWCFALCSAYVSRYSDDFLVNKYLVTVNETLPEKRYFQTKVNKDFIILVFKSITGIEMIFGSLTTSLNELRRADNFTASFMIHFRRHP